ncbi:MAG: tetratricopeptide repeat protein [Elusimicrobia bacterium]|nr:tetratricopeptide repeat protein [Elusimicrobiota bacterium]
MGQETAEALVDKGIELYNLGRFAEAARAFEEALHRGASDEKVYCFLAHSCSCAGDPGKAARILEDRARRSGDPRRLMDAMVKIGLDRGLDAPRALLILGERCAREGDHRLAEARLREAIRLDPKLARARYILGVVLQATKRPAEARQEYERALRLDDGHAEARLKLAELCVSDGLVDEAQSHLGELLRRGVMEPPVFVRLAACLIRQGRLEQAARCLAAALERRPDEPSLLFTLGSVHLQAERTDEMEGAFRAFLERAKKGEPRRRFVALMALREYAKAFKEGEALMGGRDAALDHDAFFQPWMENVMRPHSAAFYGRRAVELEGMPRKASHGPWPWFYRGLLLCRLDRAGEALAALDAVARFDQERYGWMRHAAGVRRLGLGRPAEAVDDLRCAVESRPSAWWSRCRLAEAYVCLGRDAQALEEFAAAERSCGESSAHDVRAWRGEVLLWLGRYEEAVRDLDGALARGSPLASCWRGGARLLQGRLDEALADLDAAVAACPKDAEALVFRGELKRLTGRREESLADLTAALELGVDVWAYANLALLHAASRDWPAMWGCLDKVPPDMLDACLSRLGKPAWRCVGEDEACRALEELLAAARGIRRPDKHLLGLWRRHAASPGVGPIPTRP